MAILTAATATYSVAVRRRFQITTAQIGPIPAVFRRNHSFLSTSYGLIILPGIAAIPFLAVIRLITRRLLKAFWKSICYIIADQAIAGITS